MSLETEVAALTTATTDLLAAVNVRKSDLDAKVTATATKAAEAAASAGAAAVARADALAGLGAADQSLAQALLTYGLAEAIDLAGQAARETVRLSKAALDSRSGSVTITQVASTAVDRGYATTAVVFSAPYSHTGYQLVAEVESAAPSVAHAGDVIASNRSVNGFSLSITGSATSAVIRWKTI